MTEDDVSHDLTEEQHEDAVSLEKNMTNMSWLYDHCDDIGLSNDAVMIMHSLPGKHTYRHSVQVFTNLKGIVTCKGVVALNGSCRDHPKDQPTPKIVQLCVQCTLLHKPFWQMHFVCKHCEQSHRYGK